MGLINVTPDSYVPMTNYGQFHLIFCLAILMFVYENFIIMIVQSILNKINYNLPYSLIPVSKVQDIIHIGFTSTSFLLNQILLIKPLVPIIYYILYIIIVTYGFLKAIINTILKHFTGNTLNI